MIQRAHALLKRPRLVFAILTLGALALFILLLRAPRADGQLIGSDGIYYYMVARSIVFDHDLDFANEYRFFQIPLDPARLTPTGHVPNQYAIGPALLWMPFFLLAHGLALVGHALGLWPPPDGYGWLYQAAISVGSILYGVAGLWLCFVCARRLTNERAALLAALLFWLAGNACYYWVFEPSMAHMVALLSVALLLSIWLLRVHAPDPPRLGWALALGAAGGLVLLVRLQDALALIIPAGALTLAWLAARRRGDQQTACRWLLSGGAALLATLVVFTPQLLVWQQLYGAWSISPYLSDHTPAFLWEAPQIGGVLFSSFHGLLSWHPIYLGALIGLLFLFRRERGLTLGMLLVLALTTYVVASWWAWWQGDSFGGRMFLSMTWIWVIGLATLLERIRTPRLRMAAILIGLILVGWNGLALAQYRLGLVPRDAPLTWQQMTLERVMLLWRLFER